MRRRGGAGDNMQTEKMDARMKAGGTGMPIECPSCRAALVEGMRFCRLCGYRLGEGVEEYAATRRFDETEAPANFRQATGNPFTGAPNWGVAPAAPLVEMPLLNRMSNSMPNRIASLCHPKRVNWMVWMVLVVALMTVTGVVTKRMRQRGAFGTPPAPTAPAAPETRSMIGLSDLESVDDGGGAFIEAVSVAGTPADKAGLVGGDVIIEMNGRRVEDADDLRRALAETPVGLPVELTYLRDGRTLKTTMATISMREYERLREAARAKDEGYLGIADTGDLERVDVPGQNIKGVQLGELMKNRPGDLAGLREGDIIYEFDGQPVRTEKDFIRRINQAAPGSIVKMTIMRGQERLEVPVKMGQD